MWKISLTLLLVIPVNLVETLVVQLPPTIKGYIAGQNSQQIRGHENEIKRKLQWVCPFTLVRYEFSPTTYTPY